jgi:hypothetical protein
LATFSFTLYEVFGYLLPGAVALCGFVIIYWSCFVHSIPLRIAAFQSGLLTWVAVTLVSYLLGHAAQAIGNMCFEGVEVSLLDLGRGSAPTWFRNRAQQDATQVLGLSSGEELHPKWVFRVLDEFAMQTGKEGDRDIFVYREGFYRGTALSLFFLSAALLLRTFVPGTSLLFGAQPFSVSWPELLVTAIATGAIGYLFVRRYRRFAENRVTRAVLAALIARSATAESVTVNSKMSHPET